VDRATSSDFTEHHTFKGRKERKMGGARNTNGRGKNILEPDWRTTSLTLMHVEEYY